MDDNRHLKNRLQFHINVQSFCIVLERLKDFRIGGQVICTVKYVDDVVLLAKEETVLQGVIGTLVEVRRRCGMENNVEKTKMMSISMQRFPVQIMIDQKQLETVGYLNNLCSVITNNGRRTCNYIQKQH
jgi:hypothetical protein